MSMARWLKSVGPNSLCTERTARSLSTNCPTRRGTGSPQLAQGTPAPAARLSRRRAGPSPSWPQDPWIATPSGNCARYANSAARLDELSEVCPSHTLPLAHLNLHFLLLERLALEDRQPRAPQATSDEGGGGRGFRKPRTRLETFAEEEEREGETHTLRHTRSSRRWRAPYLRRSRFPEEAGLGPRSGGGELPLHPPPRGWGMGMDG